MATEQHELWPQRQNRNRYRLHLGKEVFQAEPPLERDQLPHPWSRASSAGFFLSRRPHMGFSPWEGITATVYVASSMFQALN